MRYDDVGMFWQDVPIERTGPNANKIRPMPIIPDTRWTPPKEFPNLHSAKALCIDVETYDPELLTRGPGWGRGVGHIVGLAVGAIDAHDRIDKWYFPIRHEVQPELNLDAANVLLWARDTLSHTTQSKVGANLQYDVGWLNWENVPVAGKLIDVQFAEALLTEASPVALEALGKKYLGLGKESNALYDWCAKAYGGKSGPKQRANIYRAPVTLVGPYAESDVDLPLQLYPILYAALHKENLINVFDLENRLIPLLVAMRMQGVRVDLSKAEELRARLLTGQQIAQLELDNLAGMHVQVGSSASIARAFDDIGLRYKRTKADNPSFRKDFLGTVEHPLAEQILKVRQLEKLRGTFIEGYILNANVKGKVYGSFHQLRGDDKGTRSGRLSSSDPNLQNIPVRDPVWGQAIRSVFIPDDEHTAWRCYDYSQIEYRGLANYAVGAGSNALRQSYIDNPKTDYHDRTHGLVLHITGLDIPRKPIKNINFGGIYGVGRSKLIWMLGIGQEKGALLYDKYHEAAPYARATMNACANEVHACGYITTILGRRSRFDLWEPINSYPKRPALPYQLAYKEYGPRVKRAATYKALNRLLQGTAADIIKVAMVRCWEDGIFAVTGVPRLTVHDELDWSSTETPEVQEAFLTARHTMENAVPMRVPIIVDAEIGPNWGNLAAITE